MLVITHSKQGGKNRLTGIRLKNLDAYCHATMPCGAKKCTSYKSNSENNLLLSQSSFQVNCLVVCILVLEFSIFLHLAKWQSQQAAAFAAHHHFQLRQKLIDFLNVCSFDYQFAGFHNLAKKIYNQEKWPDVVSLETLYQNINCERKTNIKNILKQEETWDERRQFQKGFTSTLRIHLKIHYRKWLCIQGQPMWFSICYFKHIDFALWPHAWLPKLLFVSRSSSQNRTGFSVTRWPIPG